MNPAIEYLRRYNDWRTGKGERTMDEAGLTPAGITAAIDGAIDHWDKLERENATQKREIFAADERYKTLFSTLSDSAELVAKLERENAELLARAVKADAEIIAFGARPPLGTTNNAVSLAAQRSKEIEQIRVRDEIEGLRERLHNAEEENAELRKGYDSAVEALELARPYLLNASKALYDGGDGAGIRRTAMERLAKIDTLLNTAAARKDTK